MGSFFRELDLISREMERLTQDINRFETEHDLDDGENDAEERAELDALQADMRTLTAQRAYLETLEGFTSPPPSTGTVIEVPVIPVTVLLADLSANSDLQEFLGTRLGGWATLCAGRITQAMSELNVNIPDDGFDAQTLVDIVSLYPPVEKFAGASSKVFALLQSSIGAINVRPSCTFADISFDLNKAWSDFAADMQRPSTQRAEIFNSWVYQYTGGDPQNPMPLVLARRELEAGCAALAARVSPTIVARGFLLKCMECLDDPIIEIDPFMEEEGYETGDITLHFNYRHGLFSLVENYIDDAPQQLVDALRRNFGGTTRCIDLPLAMRCRIGLEYRDQGDRKHTFFLARCRSRTPGDRTFTYASQSGRGAKGDAKDEALAAWRSKQPYAYVRMSDFADS